MNDDKLTANRYRLQRELGYGGVGVVWLATDMESGGAVAVKILHDQHARDDAYVRRFHRGAEIEQRLAHPNIVRVLDEGRDGDQHFLVMEYVEGQTLAELLQERGRLSEEQARSVVQQVGAALGAAHRAGVIHRDIKPGNILIAKDGTVKVTDFDIARAEDATRMTRTGLFMGSVHYMAPEAFASKTDIRSDLYALGVVAYEMLTGRVPFDADTPLAVMRQHESQPTPELGRLRDERFRQVVQRLLSKRPEERLQTPQDLLDVLEGRREPAAAPVAQAGGGAGRPPDETRRLGWPGAGWFRDRRIRYGSLAVMAMVVVVAVVLIGAMTLGGDSGDNLGREVLSGEVGPDSSDGGGTGSDSENPVATNTPGGPTDTPRPTITPGGPPTDPPTDSPADPPTDPPTGPPTDPPTDPPTEPPSEPPTNPPSDPPSEPSTDPLTGCSGSDSDGDGIADACEPVGCWGTAGGSVDQSGCSNDQVDPDNDNVCEYGYSVDTRWCSGTDVVGCWNTGGAAVDQSGCSDDQVDPDQDDVCEYGYS